MRDSSFGTVSDRLDRLEDKIEQLADVVGRMADDVEAGFADVRKMSDSEFRQLKQAITFWGGRVRAVDDRDAMRRRG
jgi:hypothetical protein